MPLETDKTSPENEIAAAMVVALQANPLLDMPEILIDDPIDIDKAVEDMVAGTLLLDCWPYGIRQEAKNRRQYEYTYEVHLGVRAKLAEVTKQQVRTLCYYRELAQNTFGVKFRIKTASGQTYHMIESEPFAPWGRKLVHGAGLFIAPIRFAWKGMK